MQRCTHLRSPAGGAQPKSDRSNINDIFVADGVAKGGVGLTGSTMDILSVVGCGRDGQLFLYPRMKGGSLGAKTHGINPGLSSI